MDGIFMQAAVLQRNAAASDASAAGARSAD